MNLPSIGNGSIKGQELGLKRLGIDVCITDRCAECGDVSSKNLHDTISYPTIGEPFDVWMSCDSCYHEWSNRVTLSLDLTVEKP